MDPVFLGFVIVLALIGIPFYLIIKIAYRIAGKRKRIIESNLAGAEFPANRLFFHDVGFVAFDSEKKRVALGERWDSLSILQISELIDYNHEWTYSPDGKFKSNNVLTIRTRNIDRPIFKIMFSGGTNVAEKCAATLAACWAQ